MVHIWSRGALSWGGGLEVFEEVFFVGVLVDGDEEVVGEVAEEGGAEVLGAFGEDELGGVVLGVDGHVEDGVFVVDGAHP